MEAMRGADLAMYEAKSLGGSRWSVYRRELNDRAQRRFALEGDLRTALDEDAFHLNYQPIVDLASGSVVAVEALIRWNHATRGLIPPDAFIPLAEETGLIVPIGNWVLHTACLQNMAWQKQGLPRLKIAVNLTARQFTDEHLVREIRSALDAAGMDASLLEIELHESSLIQNIEKTLHILRRLKAMGVRIAIDDFGTGYSSLATLQQFPLDTIKIDRSYIRDLATQDDDSQLTKAIIAMGKSLSLTVVAQGVETKEQADFLRAHACDEIQGFYFSKPMSAPQFTALLQAQKPDPTLSGSRAAIAALTP
jgi:EAL domain-containing protein (putative c-di-GMP-specific phosphodiesterase class I)